jgi:hypothetical protein
MNPSGTRPATGSEASPDEQFTASVIAAGGTGATGWLAHPATIPKAITVTATQRPLAHVVIAPLCSCCFPNTL